MIAKDPRINKLILKWANDIFGNWKDVETDLVDLEKQIREDERQRMGYHEPIDKKDLYVPYSGNI